jgi:hypothetical protein
LERGGEQRLSDTIDLDELRTRLRKMGDTELLRFGKAAKYMCSPQASLGKPPRRSFVMQLGAKAEWRRQNGKTNNWQDYFFSVVVS